jgi:hypothetical protein
LYIDPSRRVIDALTHSTLNVLNELGSGVSSAVLYHIQRQLSVTQEALFEDPNRFVSSFEGLFGSGALLLEEKIIDSMCSELKVKLDKSSGGSFIAKFHEICSKETRTRHFQLDALEESMKHD